MAGISLSKPGIAVSLTLATNQVSLTAALTKERLASASTIRITTQLFCETQTATRSNSLLLQPIRLREKSQAMAAVAGADAMRICYAGNCPINALFRDSPSQLAKRRC